MSLRVVGAGVGRTGTASLKMALERLLDAPCYHMIEVFQHPEHVPEWHKAMLGQDVDWNRLFAGFVAAVDWPAGACWPELMRAYPDAPVLLSIRNPEAWWTSANETIFTHLNDNPMAPPGWLDMVHDMIRNRFGTEVIDRETCIAAFNAHNARVRAEVPKERLLVWEAADGWAPICAALHVAIPDEPFPRTNTTEEWRARSAARAEQARAETK
ncbi:MAG TPA: sulfotransferase [Rhizomicrobium sp.]|nr:sulfotransferase [Rhizomicrobium sp.]